MAVQARKPSFTKRGVRPRSPLAGQSVQKSDRVRIGLGSLGHDQGFNVLLYKRYRPKGVPPLSWKSGGSGWLGVAKTLPHLTDDGKRNRWLWQFGWRYGRLLGSLRHHVLAL